jgi:hypothetical protein
VEFLRAVEPRRRIRLRDAVGRPEHSFHRRDAESAEDGVPWGRLRRQGNGTAILPRISTEDHGENGSWGATAPRQGSGTTFFHEVHEERLTMVPPRRQGNGTGSHTENTKDMEDGVPWGRLRRQGNGTAFHPRSTRRTAYHGTQPLAEATARHFFHEAHEGRHTVGPPPPPRQRHGDFATDNHGVSLLWGPPRAKTVPGPHGMLTELIVVTFSFK